MSLMRRLLNYAEHNLPRTSTEAITASPALATRGGMPNVSGVAAGIGILLNDP